MATSKKPRKKHAAASARLCVETQATLALDSLVSDAAASARLCVETWVDVCRQFVNVQPPPRGCVLKLLCDRRYLDALRSRLRAAVC